MGAHSLLLFGKAQHRQSKQTHVETHMGHPTGLNRLFFGLFCPGNDQIDDEGSILTLQVPPSETVLCERLLG